MRTIRFVDTTLRDGFQGTSRELSPSQAAGLAVALVEAGVDEIEGGVAARFEDRERLRAIRTELPKARLSVWCRLRGEDLGSALGCGADVVHLSAPGSDRLLHALGVDRSWRAQALQTLLSKARSSFVELSLGIQDAPGTDPSALSELLGLASRYGVTRVRLADSAGRWLPAEAARAVARLLPFASGIELGIHAHDDLGLATAVSLAALEAGATWCDVTVCGIGERSGNAALEQVVLACQRLGLSTRLRPKQFRDLAARVMSLAGREVPPDQPIVGEACFAHHSGLHQAAMHLDPGCYEPFDPADVGASRTECIGVHTGRKGLARALARLGLPSDPMGVAFLLPHVIRLARDRGRPLLDTEIAALAHSSIAPNERKRSWPSTNPPTTSSSAIASASVVCPREPATARKLRGSSSISRRSSRIAASTPSSRPPAA
jgi:homocitrate synthase NifV